jgi:hypothetical protein
MDVPFFIGFPDIILSLFLNKFMTLTLLEQFVDQQEKLVPDVGKEPEDPEGISEAKAHPFKPLFKNASGGAFSPFGKNIVKIAAPEAEALVEPAAVPGYPPFAAFDPLSHQEEGGSGLSYGLKKGRFFLTLKPAGITAHYTEAGKCLPYVPLGFFEHLPFAAQYIGGEFPLFQNGQDTDHKIEGHIAYGGFAGQKFGAPDKAPGYGDDQGSAGNKGTVFPCPSGAEQIPKGKQDDVPAVFGVQKVQDNIGQMFLGHNIQRYLKQADPFR